MGWPNECWGKIRSTHKVRVVSRTYRHIERYRQIIPVLFKYGFGDVIDARHIGRYVDIARPKRSGESKSESGS